MPWIGHPDNVFITRQELYERVWSAPVSQLRQSFGISDVAIAKLCKRAGVPISYWQQLKAGQKVRKPPLPPLKKGQRETVYYQRSKKRPAPSIPIHPQSIQVGPRLGKLHPMLATTREVLTLRLKLPNPPDTQEPPIDVKVTPKSLPRAPRILNALFKALEKYGHTVEHRTGHWPGSVVKVGEQAVRFSLHEHERRLEQPLTKEQLQLPWWQRPSKYRYEYQGQLVFELDLYTDRAVRKS